MTKRPCSQSVAPIKLVKVEEDWTLVREDDVSAARCEHSAVTPTVGWSSSTHSSLYSQVRRVFTLCHSPKMEVSISLNGVLPEVRFTSPDNSITITGDEFLELANSSENWPINPTFLPNTRLEPLGGGSFRFVRYSRCEWEEPSPAQMLDFFPTAVFDMPRHAVDQLKLELDVMSEHVFKLQESESYIQTMFACVLRVFREEYIRLATLKPITDHFEELCAVVESHTLPSRVVGDFHSNTSGSPWVHSSLLSVVLAQKKTILSML